MAALEARQPSISTTVTFVVMSKNARLMSFLTLAGFRRNRNLSPEDAGAASAAERVVRPQLSANPAMGDCDDAETLHEA
jgi:hypothetical protein